jgi:hypothetical protein
VGYHVVGIPDAEIIGVSAVVGRQGPDDQRDTATVEQTASDRGPYFFLPGVFLDRAAAPPADALLGGAAFLGVAWLVAPLFFV